MLEIPPFATDDGVERILVVVAHPDDIDFGTAGSVAVWTDAGIEVTLLHGHRAATPAATTGRCRVPTWPTCAGPSRPTAAKQVGVTRTALARVPRRARRADARPAPRHLAGDPRRPAAAGRLRCRLSGSWDRVYGNHPDHLATGGGDGRGRLPGLPQPVRAPRAARRGPRAVDGSAALGAWRDRAATSTSTRPTRSTASSRRCCRTRARSRAWSGPPRSCTMWGEVNAEFAGLPEGRYCELFHAIDGA